MVQGVAVDKIDLVQEESPIILGGLKESLVLASYIVSKDHVELQGPGPQALTALTRQK